MLVHLWDHAQRAAQPSVASASTKATSVQDSLNAIVKLIPVEVIGVYLALVGIFGQSWEIFWIGAALIPIVLTIVHFERKKRLKQGEVSPTFVKLLLIILFAFIAYVPWVGTLPETPFLQFTSDATKYSAGTALVLSAFLPRLARLLGINA